MSQQDQPVNPQDPQQPPAPGEQPGGPQASGSGSAASQTPPKRKRRRRWPWVILILFILLIVLIALVPTIASTGPVRSMIVSKVNNNLNGHVEIEGWSVGWTSPVAVNGVKVYDSRNSLILDVPRIHLGLSILDAIEQNFHFGNDNVIEVASFVVRTESNGNTNLQNLVKESPSTPPAPKSQPSSKLPDISGKFTVVIHQGTIENPQGPPVQVDPSQIVATITDINKPIDNQLKLAFHVGELPPSTVEASGSVDAIENNQIDIAKLVAQEQILLSKVNLAAAEPFVKNNGAKIAGIADGRIDFKAQGLTGISTDGQIVVTNLVAGGAMLNGDQYSADKVTIPLKITRAADPKNPNSTIITFENVGVQTPQANVAINGQVSEQALLNLSKNQAPGSDGTLSISANVTDLKSLAAQLHNTLKLDPSVQVESGKITNDIAIVISADSVKATAKVNADAKGQRSGKPIELKPIAMNFNGTAFPNGKPIPDVKDLALNVTSNFITITGGGQSLAKIDIKGSLDLDALRSQAAQFTDLSKYQIQGKGDFAVNTAGDVTQPNAPIDASATINLSNVKLAGVTEQSIDQDRLSIAAGGKLTRQDNAPTGVQNGSIKLTSGDPASPTLTMMGSADVDLSKRGQIAAPKWQFTVDTASLPTLQKQYGAMVPALSAQKLDITSGGFHLHGGGSYDGTTLNISDPIALSIPSLQISRAGKQIISGEVIRGTLGGSVSLGQDRVAASLTAVSLISQNGLINVAKSGESPLVVSMIPSKNQIDGSGTITIASNIKRVADLAQALSDQVTQASEPQLRSGQFNGTISIARTDTTKLDFSGQIGSLTVSANGKNAIENEQIGMSLNAVAPNDLAGTKPIAASGKLTSSFITTDLSNVAIAMNGSVLDKLQSADIDAKVPGLDKLYALMQAFSPPATAAPQAPPARPTAQLQQPNDDAPVRGNERISAPRAPRPPRNVDRADAVTATSTEPIAPLEIRRGAATLKLHLARDVSKQTTTLTISDAQITNLSLRRGDRQFDAKSPIALKLNTQLKAATLDKIESLQIDPLRGTTEFATFQTSQPIVISDPLGKQPSVSGELKSNGDISGAEQLVSVIQGADPMPYAGTFDLTQKIATSGNLTTLNGLINVADFVARDAARKVVFTEKQVAIRNDVSADLAQHNATVNTFTLDMPQTQALGVKFSGQVLDWANARTIKGVSSDRAKLTLTYDLAKLWPIIQPMLSPEMQQQYQSLKIAGKATRDYAIWGSMPAEHPPTVTALAQLNASGSLALDLLDLPQGLTFKSFDLPFTMNKGVLRTAPAPDSPDRQVQVTLSAAQRRRAGTPPAAAGQPEPAQPAGTPGQPAMQQAMAKTAVANEGALNLDQIVLEMDKPDMPLSISRRHVLLNDIRLNPVLADALGKMGALVLSGANKAEGLVTITVDQCDHVPLADLMRKKTGTAQFTLQIEDLRLDGTVTSLLAKAANFGPDGFAGSIPPSTIKLANGMAETHLTVQLDRMVKDERTGRDVMRGMPIVFAGGLNLQSLSLKNFTVDIPGGLINHQFAQAFPNGLAVPLTGTATSPQLDLSKALQSNIGNLLGGIGGGNDNKSGAGNENPLGNILDQLTGDKKDEKPPANQPAPRPRRPAR